MPAESLEKGLFSEWYALSFSSYRKLSSPVSTPNLIGLEASNMARNHKNLKAQALDLKAPQSLEHLRFRVKWGLYRGLHRDNGKAHGNCYSIGFSL